MEIFMLQSSLVYRDIIVQCSHDMNDILKLVFEISRTHLCSFKKLFFFFFLVGFKNL